MGAVQKLATVVIVGLVALATVLVFYLADEGNRIKAEESAQEHDAIERATANYISLCLPCHGPGGEGYTAAGEAGTGRVGAPLGGINTALNQTGVNAAGTPYPGGVAARATVISDTIHNGLPGSTPGTYRMPPWSELKGGPLNDSQIEELVLMIQNVDWNEVYNEAIKTYGGYPTAQPAATTAPTGETPTPTDNSGGGSEAAEVDMVDIAFNPKELTIAANTDVTINLKNSGAATHNFNLEAQGIHSGDIAGGGTGSVVVNLPPGDYEYQCDIPGHKEAGMIGTLHVVEGGAAPAGGDQPAAPTQEEQAPSTDQGAAAPAPEVDMVDIAFNPKELTIAANTDVTINLKNSGAATHNFNIESEGIHSGDYAGGQTGTIVVNLPPGEYEYQCDIPGHKEAGMVGKLIVQ